eukprot:scaffold222483_cov20-Prasinocladus_malaysianus.AAC.1
MITVQVYRRLRGSHNLNDSSHSSANLSRIFFLSGGCKSEASILRYNEGGPAYVAICYKNTARRRSLALVLLQDIPLTAEESRVEEALSLV